MTAFLPQPSPAHYQCPDCTSLGWVFTFRRRVTCQACRGLGWLVKAAD